MLFSLTKRLLVNDEGKSYLEFIDNDPKQENPIALLYFEEFPSQEKGVLKLDLSSVVLGDVSEPDC
jgi:hypothetical protein